MMSEYEVSLFKRLRSWLANLIGGKDYDLEGKERQTFINEMGWEVEAWGKYTNGFLIDKCREIKSDLHKLQDSYIAIGGALTPRKDDA